MNDATTGLGIENAKMFLTALAGQVFAAANIDDNRDGEVTTGEWSGFGTQLILAVLGNLSVGRNAFPEFADIKGSELAELTDHVLKTNFLPDDRDQAEALVKTVLVLAYINTVGVQNIQATLAGTEPRVDIFNAFQAIIALDK